MLDHHADRNQTVTHSFVLWSALYESNPNLATGKTKNDLEQRQASGCVIMWFPSFSCSSTERELNVHIICTFYNSSIILVISNDTSMILLVRVLGKDLPDT